MNRNDNEPKPIGAAPAAITYGGIYINLDRSRERRLSMEQQLALLRVADRYMRLRAIDGRNLLPVGSLNSGIVGCFHSHTTAVGLAAEADMPLHIVEDDVVLSAHVEPFMNHALSRGLFETFDILFLDMWIDPSLRLIELYLNALARAAPLTPLDVARLSVVDLKHTRIGAAASYVVAPAKAGRLHDRMEQELKRGPTMPVDHFFSRLKNRGTINCAVIAPFLTTIDLERGAISHTLTLGPHQHRLFLLLRNAFFVDRDLAGVVLPGLDEYRDTGRFPGLREIRDLLARSGESPLV
jgi:GR25 family glycosyltransferase involved in LPS biosynthesis